MFKTQQEKDTAIEAARKQLAEVESATVSGRWAPKDGDVFYYLDDVLDVKDEYFVSEGNFSTLLFRSFNCFPTYDAAQQEADRMLIDRELRAFTKECNAGEELDWKNKSQEKWGLYLCSVNTDNPHIECHNVQHIKILPLAECVFVGPEADDNAHAALDRFGDRLLLLTRP